MHLSIVQQLSPHKFDPLFLKTPPIKLQFEG
jgi:hypothetical protein